jgi:heme/copper-type cytochrome/quinol oxidase subunit 3
MTAVIPAGPVRHEEDVDTIGRRWRLGVLLLMFADASFVASMVFTYFYLRGLNTDGGWLPKGAASTPIWIGWAIGAGVVISAIAYRRGQLGILAGDEHRLVNSVAVAVFVMVLVGVAQIVQLSTFPFGIADGSYASTTFLLGAANVFHVLLTLFLGLGIWNRGRLRKYTSTNNWQVRLVGLWWTWIAVAALVAAFTMSFVASPQITVGNG